MISFAWAAVRVNELLGVFLQRRAPGEQPRGLDLRGEVGDLRLDRLEFGDRLAEGPALLGVGDRLVERPLGQPDPHRRDADPAAVEDVEEVLEALAPPAEQASSATLQSSKESGRVSEAFQPILR